MFSEQHEGLDGTKRADSRGVDMRLTDRISLHTNACTIMQALHAATEKALHLANMELQQVSFVLPFHRSLKAFGLCSNKLRTRQPKRNTQSAFVAQITIYFLDIFSLCRLVRALERENRELRDRLAAHEKQLIGTVIATFVVYLSV